MSHPEHIITLFQRPQIKFLKKIELSKIMWYSSIAEDQLRTEAIMFFNEWQGKDLPLLTSLKITSFKSKLIDVLLNRVFSKSVLLKELDLE